MAVPLCPSLHRASGQGTSSRGAMAVGADAHRGLDLVLPPGADREPRVGLAPIPRYLAVEGPPLEEGCLAQGQLRLG